MVGLLINKQVTGKATQRQNTLKSDSGIQHPADVRHLDAGNISALKITIQPVEATQGQQQQANYGGPTTESLLENILAWYLETWT